MTHFHLFDKGRRRPRWSGSVAGEEPPKTDPSSDPDDPLLDPPLVEPEPASAWAARAGRRNTREKLVAGLLGIKHAVRGDSSFFAHAYRGLLIAIAAMILGIPPIGWCFLVVSAALVLIAEMAHSAIDTLARAIGDPEETRLKVAREIAAGGVVIASICSAAITITVLTVKLGELLAWWS